MPTPAHRTGLTETEKVWRYLLDLSVSTKRRHPSITAVADNLGIPVSTVHQALKTPTRIGAVTPPGRSGFALADPFRLAGLWAGRRRLDRDETATWRTYLRTDQAEMACGPVAVRGGVSAVIAHMGHINLGAHDSEIRNSHDLLVYAEDLDEIRRRVPEDPEGATMITVATPDSLLLARYGRVTSLHQAWVDLYVTPGWVAANVVGLLARRWAKAKRGNRPSGT